MKNLKMPKEQYKPVIRRTDNSIAKKGTKRQTLVHKALHRKINILQHERTAIAQNTWPYKCL